MTQAKTLFTGTAFKNKVLAAAKIAREQGKTEIFLEGEDGPKIFLDKEPKTIIHTFKDEQGTIHVGSNQ